MAIVKWDHRLVNAKDLVVNAKSNQVFVDFFHKEEQLYSSCYQVRDFVVSTVEILFYFLKPISTHSISYRQLEHQDLAARSQFRFNSS